MWDLDGGFWGSSPCGDWDSVQWGLFEIAPCHGSLPMFERVVDVPAWRDQYLEAAREFTTGPFAHDAYVARVEAVVTQIRDALAEDPNRRGDDAEWQAAIDDLIRLHQARIDHVSGQLADHGYPID
jgi:hypothetical protein